MSMTEIKRHLRCSVKRIALLLQCSCTLSTMHVANSDMLLRKRSCLCGTAQFVSPEEIKVALGD